MINSGDKKRLLASDDERKAIAAAIASPQVRMLPEDAWLLAGAAVALGLLADVLFNGASLGVNLPIWLAAAVTALWLAGRKLGMPIERRRLVLLVAAVGFSCLLAWRDSDTLGALNLLCASSLIVLGVALPAGVGFRRIGPLAVALALVAGAVSLVSVVWRLASLIPWGQRLAPSHRNEAPMVGRALLVSTPILLTFGGLFFAADAVFAAQVENIVSFGFGDVSSHALWLIGGAWLAATLLWSGLAVSAPEDLDAELPQRHRLKLIEIGIVLGPLVVLFALFVTVQVRYMFSGEAAVQESLDLTYSQYARRGFFELVVASVLLLPVLFGFNWARRQEKASTLLFAGLSTALVVLLFVVMASAWQRLSIYVDAFGLTELRFYAAALLPWLVVAFVWFLISVARRQREDFFPGAALAAMVALVVLNVVSPDAVIADTNTRRLDTGSSFDGAYATSLSADAVPTLVEKLGAMPAPERCQTAQHLLQTWSSREQEVRSWNLARLRARRAVGGEIDRLEAACSLLGN